MKNQVCAVVGANWGDEGKGKITDMLADSVDMVIRFQGGANAGHTVINEQGKFALHALPSGVFGKNTLNLIGSGMALDIRKLMNEIKYLEEKGVSVTPENLGISERCQVVMPYHILFDEYEEERLSDSAFGSTKSGIAPFYADKYAKIGFQLCELFDDELMITRLNSISQIKNVLLEHLYHKPLLDSQAILKEMSEQRELIKPFIKNVHKIVQDGLKNNKTMLLEGQLGTLKDPDFGIYPMVTSSHTVAAFGCISAGIPPKELTKVVAVTKAYSTAVGGGDFVSELFGDEAEQLRINGGDAGEFGVTTGRPRRVGWFDAVATKYGVKMQGATEVVLTCIDVLGYLDEIKVCVGYDINGTITTDFPTTGELAISKPVYETFKGWKSDVRGVLKYEDLPVEARDLVDFLEKSLDTPINLVSTGPKRHEICERASKI